MTRLTHNLPDTEDLKGWIAFIAIGVAMLCLWCYGALNIYPVLASRQWPSVTGKIIRSAVERSPGTYRTSAPSKTAVIAYRYRTDGKVYSSDRVLWGNTTYHFGFNEPEQLKRRYPVGKTVSVYYNPADPAQAVLERRARVLDSGLVGFSSFVLLLQIIFLMHLRQKQRDENRRISR